MVFLYGGICILDRMMIFIYGAFLKDLYVFRHELFEPIRSSK